METLAKIAYRPAAVDRGYTDHLLRVDLTSGSLSVEPIAEEVRNFFLGGRGYCLWLVHEGTRAGTRYDSPENVLAISGGPFCGESSFPGAGKFIVGTVSPLTGTFVDSNVGGHFFALAKEAGLDAIAVTGKSETEVMLLVDGDAGEISLVKAPEKEGGITVAEEVLESYRGEGKPWNVAMVTTGKGAKSSFYGIVNSVYFDKKRNRCRSKQAGRGGTGTVMRHKGLRGIVVRSNKPRAHANHPVDSRSITDAGRKLRKVIKEVDPKAIVVFIPGCPPKPEAMILGVAKALASL